MITTEWIRAALAARRATPTGPTPSDRRTGPSGRRARGDWGEGVISAAIAVLIMAFLGAAMWLGFNRMWKTTEATTNQKVEQIGSDTP